MEGNATITALFRGFFVSLLLGAVLSRATFVAAEPAEPVKAGANAESDDEVRTEIEEETTRGERARKRGRVREYWIWDGKTHCWEEEGEIFYVVLPPPKDALLRNPRLQVRARYERWRSQPNGRRVLLKTECRPLPKPKTPRPPTTASRDAVTRRVEDWLKVPA